LESRLEDQSRITQSLESQIKELTREKNKLERLLEKEGAKLTK